MSTNYDVAIVGGGPVGSVCALAHARKGLRVVMLEANPKSAYRLAGEWLHPPAVRILEELGVELSIECKEPIGKGFAIFPEDGTEAIRFPYSSGVRGFSCEHSTLVASIHKTVKSQPNIDFIVDARAAAVEDGCVEYTFKGKNETIHAPRIVGADGQASIVRQSLGLSISPKIISQTVGIILNDVELPLEGYGHVFLGGPGPILIYRLSEGQVRLISDIPQDRTSPKDRIAFLLDSYTEVLPDTIKPSFMEALRTKKFQIAINKVRPHVTYGSARRILIGDAAGHYHPMTAMGMTFGFGDAFALADHEDFKTFTRKRFRETHTPSFLAMGLYEVFADYHSEAVAIRHSIYGKARASSSFRYRTIRLLACDDTSAIRMNMAFFGTVVQAVFRQIPITLNRLAWKKSYHTLKAMCTRIWWLLQSIKQLYKVKYRGEDMDDRAWKILSGVFMFSVPFHSQSKKPASKKDASSPDASPALHSAVSRLADLQREDGSWEGEMVWCPMLTAQYALLHYIIGKPLSAKRRKNILRSFMKTRFDDGTWGMHEHSEPHLFVTTLVYIASRLLGIERDDAMLKPAQEFMETEGVVNIPSWGKFWLAVLNLYEWKGVNAVLPELWVLPRWLPIHPSKWYCHTRLIYMAMSVIYGHRFQTPLCPVIESLREELYPNGFDQVDFSKTRNLLREGDLFRRPNIVLRAANALTKFYEERHHKAVRKRSMDSMTEKIKWELQTTDHTSISPVSGTLNILALWLQDNEDPDAKRGLDQLEGWVWEDREDGARVTGARSGSWDTGFALQALEPVANFSGTAGIMKCGAQFLAENQIRTSFEGYSESFRNDPRGGWCFAGGWHGWPVSDCTAEAVLGLISFHGKAADRSAIKDAIEFMLRAQNRDGSFGSYESIRSRIGLEWLNPAEMFGESMTEGAYVECTASCLEAFSACKEHFPDLVNTRVMKAIIMGDAWLRKTQRSDGSWRGVWGIQYIYGTLFGIRGLMATGAKPSDPALRLACRWLLDCQHDDGGWGEHHSGCMSGEYVDHEASQVIQSAWALIALQVARDGSWNAITRGAQYLLDMQQEDGSWPKQDMAGVFFRTALLDYVLYRQYFPLHALGLYEKNRLARMNLTASVIPKHEAEGITASEGPLNSPVNQPKPLIDEASAVASNVK
ncbi:MAG: FAD-dependent monooxygenase [Gammaproteobacteria bacterium]|nr:FAD-dependent monooxygenase [Gammaproteobacteria bacterium]